MTSKPTPMQTKNPERNPSDLFESFLPLFESRSFEVFNHLTDDLFPDNLLVGCVPDQQGIIANDIDHSRNSLAVLVDLVKGLGS